MFSVVQRASNSDQKRCIESLLSVSSPLNNLLLIQADIELGDLNDLCLSLIQYWISLLTRRPRYLNLKVRLRGNLSLELNVLSGYVDIAHLNVPR